MIYSHYKNWLWSALASAVVFVALINSPVDRLGVIALGWCIGSLWNAYYFD